MEILSLNEAPKAPGRRLSRAEAIGASMGVHVLLLLLFLRGLEGLPTPLAAWIRKHAAQLPVPVAVQPVPAENPASPAVPKEKEKEKIPPIPLKFAYVKVPEEAQQQKNPNAAMLSDRDRHARQEMPTPPDAKRFTRDPHSEGDSRDRVRPDPRLKEGRDQPEPPSPPTDRIASKDVDGKPQDSPDDRKAGASGEASETPDEPRPDRLADNRADARPPEANGRGNSVPLPGQAGHPAPGEAGHDGGPGASRRPDLREGSEFKFRFENPGWLKGGAFDGTLSFDTKGYPWGDYARKIYVIIRNNWFDRIPLAAREGIQGYTCQHFVIGRDGTISSLDILKTSPVPPFNKAASDALRASSALPPLPSDFEHDSEGVTFCFFYNMYPEEAD